MQLNGRVAVVTGASSGIGAATACALAGQGMQVVAVARRTERLAELQARDDRIVAYTADVTVHAEVEALAEWVKQEFRACHVLVNNAGANYSRRFRGLDDLEAMAKTMDVNFFGTVRTTAAFAALLEASAPSRLINVASVAGKLSVGPPAYVASKFAAVGFTEAIGADWARRGVAVCQVNPGYVRTEGFPQDHLNQPVVRQLVGGPGLVADAIVEVSRSGARERTVPRWYRPLVAGRHLLAPFYWAIANRLPWG